MLPCFSDRKRIAPSDHLLDMSGLGSMEAIQENEELRKPLNDTPSPFTSNPTDYNVFQAVGMGCYGAASILIAQHRPSLLFSVLREVDLEMLSVGQLEEVQQEMKLSQLLSHANIACYYCCFVVGPKLWAVQALMHYGSCADIMHSAEPFRNGFKEHVIGVILRDVVRGLSYLHTQGYVHRSIRAKHFLIHKDGLVKLSGLRSVVSMIHEGARVKSLHGHFSGTVDNICWLAPEVIAQDLAGYTLKSDIYSIGIAVLELATGEAPFAGLPVTEIMMLKLRGHPPIMLRKQDEDPAQFSNTFSKVVDLCVHPDPSVRPSTNKLLHMSFLKMRKKSVGMPSLKELLRPVVPLDTSHLTPDQSKYGVTDIEPDVERLSVQESWAL